LGQVRDCHPSCCLELPPYVTGAHRPRRRIAYLRRPGDEGIVNRQRTDRSRIKRDEGIKDSAVHAMAEALVPRCRKLSLPGALWSKPKEMSRLFEVARSEVMLRVFEMPGRRRA
jgi:hypothetical protein